MSFFVPIHFRQTTSYLLYCLTVNQYEIINDPTMLCDYKPMTVPHILPSHMNYPDPYFKIPFQALIKSKYCFHELSIQKCIKNKEKTSIY